MRALGFKFNDLVSATKTYISDLETILEYESVHQKGNEENKKKVDNLIADLKRQEREIDCESLYGEGE